MVWLIVLTDRCRSGLKHRLPRLLLGLVLCGIGIALMVAGDLGLGPWDVLHQGVSRLTGVPIGVASILTGLAIFGLWLPLRQRPRIGTVLAIVGIGAVIDLTLLWLDTPSSMAGRTAMMLHGTVLFGIGSGLYIGAGLGPGPRDGVMTGIVRRWRFPIGSVRACLEISALVSGWMLGGTVGVGTVVFAVAIGPLVHWTLPRLSVPDVYLDATRPTKARSAG